LPFAPPILAELDGLPPTPDDLGLSLVRPKYYLADDIPTKSDRMSMAHSEVRRHFSITVSSSLKLLPASSRFAAQQKFILKN
jgi:hypothetical protein